MYKAIIAIGIAAAACLMVGCGSSGDETAAAAVTKTEFIKQADAVCSKVAKEREAELEDWKDEYKGGEAEAQENLGDGLRKVIVPSMERQVEGLEALEAPAGDSQTVDQMVASLDDIRTVLAEQGVKGLPKIDASQYEKETAAYGLKVCRYP